MQAPDATLLYTDVEDKKSSSVKIKPNPVVESLGVEGLNNEEVSFAIYDSMGKLVRIGMIFAPYQIGVSDLQRGTYILRLYDGGNFIYLKFIKE